MLPPQQRRRSMKYFDFDFISPLFRIATALANWPTQRRWTWMRTSFSESGDMHLSRCARSVPLWSFDEVSELECLTIWDNEVFPKRLSQSLIQSGLCPRHAQYDALLPESVATLRSALVCGNGDTKASQFQCLGSPPIMNRVYVPLEKSKVSIPSILDSFPNVMDTAPPCLLCMDLYK
jgi:hypothetical protein